MKKRREIQSPKMPPKNFTVEQIEAAVRSVSGSRPEKAPKSRKA